MGDLEKCVRTSGFSMANETLAFVDSGGKEGVWIVSGVDHTVEVYELAFFQRRCVGSKRCDAAEGAVTADEWREKILVTGTVVGVTVIRKYSCSFDADDGIAEISLRDG
jgi:hypothetical protein